MWHLNSVISQFFDLALVPLQSFGPAWGLILISLLTGAGMLLIFRYTSDQEKIRAAKDRIKAHLLEIRLFKDDPHTIWSAQKNILFYNLKYMKCALKPMLFLILPVVILLIQLDGWFGKRPLNIGESAIVSVKMLGNDMKIRSEVELKAMGGLVVETPTLRIPETMEVDWRIRAKGPGEHKLTVMASGYTLEKKVIVSDGDFMRISPRLVAAGFWDTFLNPGETPFRGNPVVKSIEVDYPLRSFTIWKWKVHWILAFFIFSILFGFLLKGVFRVEI